MKKSSDPKICGLRWPTTVTAKTKYLTAKPKTSRQKQNTSLQNQNPHGKTTWPHGKTKYFTAKTKYLSAKANTHGKSKAILFLLWSILFFCCEVFGFAVSREVFGFAVRYFVFAVRFLVLPWQLWATSCHPSGLIHPAVNCCCPNLTAHTEFQDSSGLISWNSVPEHYTIGTSALFMYRSNRSFNMPPPGQPPGHLTFLKIIVQIPP